ncbi:MAG: iron-containing alcohol dehydrogenase, partial [Chitinispirillaceae bacterium]|nr:iron-containing alcohol dehydrogenase [Chitinispirillaceae bacterium]
MTITDFTFIAPRKIIFGPGTSARLGITAAAFGRQALVLRNRSIARNGGQWDSICQSMDSSSVKFHALEIHGEPSPEVVDAAVMKYGKSGIEAVIAIGGGSVIDAGKAISAMLPAGGPVADYLEGIGRKTHPGTKVPFIAVPTTAGTGSEASANAVLSRIGADGFKKSLRHENFSPDVALVDPELALSCPSPVTAACGMDAFTQLLEAYVSPRASPVTDALVENALTYVRGCLVAAAGGGAGNIAIRSGMAYAALVSGIALANAGLGVVHGIASPLGGHFTIPHGVVCGTLIGKAVEITVASLEKNDPGHSALAKYARAGAIVSDKKSDSVNAGCRTL